MTCNSGHMVTSCPMAEHSISTKGLSKAVLQRYSNCLQMMAKPCSKILYTPLWFTDKSLSETTKSISACCWHFKCHWIGWITCPRGRETCTAGWTCYRNFSCWSPKSKLQLSELLGKRAEIKLRKECVASKIHISLLSFVPLFILGQSGSTTYHFPFIQEITLPWAGLSL